MTKPGGEKIAAAPPCYGSEPLVEERTFFPPIGRSTKVRTIYASNFCSFTTNKEYDDGFPGILYQTGGLGWVNPNKSVHARSHHMENRKKISVGRNIGTTRVLRSGCKINFLRRRRQRLASLEKNRKKLAPAPNKPRPRMESCCDEHIMNGDKIAPPCVPIERRFKFTECHEASLFPGRTIKIRTMSDTQNMGCLVRDLFVDE
ncbi:BnaC02g19920D [Brassica napus]|uniref:BnaC02g19920D protein n=1 Tax=Brassica napus TaxID=3708 RepID=A0A078F4P8_BRANA|nr:BnaC02g19920D [Brassica napus]